MIPVLDPVLTRADIPARYRKTPIGLLLEYHNLGRSFERYERAQLLIGMCMDNRKHMTIPDNFAFIIRAGGANMRYSEFKLSFAIAIGGVHHMALIGHTHCGMTNLVSRREDFIRGLVKNAGWSRREAEGHFQASAPLYEIGEVPSFILSEAERLRRRYPKIVVAPMIYKVEDNRLYLLRERAGRTRKTSR